VGILFGFAPWIVYWVLVGNASFLVAALGAFAIAIAGMLERFPRLRLQDPAAPVTYKGSYFLRGLASLAMATD